MEKINYNDTIEESNTYIYIYIYIYIKLNGYYFNNTRLKDIELIFYNSESTEVIICQVTITIVYDDTINMYLRTIVINKHYTHFRLTIERIGIVIRGM